MPTVIASGQLTLLDLNDAFVAGTQPTNPVEGMLWIDTSTTPSKLKIYKLGTWVPQTLSLVDLDPDYGAQKGKIDDLIDDAKLSHTERGDLATILYELIPVLPSVGVALSQAGTSADTAPELFSGATWQAGLIYQVRKAALDVGLLATHATFVATKTKYNALVTQLNLMKTASAPVIYGWETATSYKATFVPASNGDAFRTALKEMYQAINALATLTTDFVNDEAIYKDSFKSQLVGNAYGDVGTNRNFTSFTFNTTEKVSGKGSFARSATGVVFSDDFINVDTTRNYVLRVQIKNSTTTGSQVVGVYCYNSAGTAIGERYLMRNSSNGYLLPSTTSWTPYIGRIGGLGGGTDVNSSMFPVGTVKLKIYFSTNISTTTNTAYFADIEFDVEKIEAGVDYNGINLSGMSGITVESLKNTLTMNATKGIEIIKKSDPSNPIFKVDSTTGDLQVKGNINMTSGSISWANVGSPTAAQVGAATPADVAGAVNNLTIGGRNLLLGTDKTFTSTRVSDAQNKGFSFPSGDLMAAISRNGVGTVLEENTEYVFSFDYEFTAGYTGTIGIGVGTGSSPTSFEVDRFHAQAPYATYGQGTKGKFVIKMNTGTLGVYKYFMIRPLRDDLVAGTSTIVMKNLKLEKGNKMTDWTPAPEDTATAIDNVTVGGRNLIPNSGMFQNLKGWFNAGTLTTKDGYPVIYSTGTGYISTGNLQILEPNTEYVCTMEIMLAANFLAGGVVPNHIYAKRVSDNADMHGGMTLIGGPRTLLANKWEKVSVTFKTLNTSDPLYFKFHDYTSSTSVDKWLRSVKLEKGNKPTDWSPAPEDASAEVNALRTAAAASGLVTVIDANTVQTGKIKADFIDVKGLTVNNGSKNTFAVDSNGNVSVDGNINMTGGSISWANVGSPTAAQVGAATPSDVAGAVSDLVVGSRNLLLNSTFNDNFSKWTNIASGYAVLPPESDKPYSKIATVTRSGLTSAGYASIYSTKGAASAGSSYTVSFDFKVTDFSVFSDMPYVGILEFYSSMSGTSRVQFKDLMISDCGYSTLENNKWYRMSYTMKATTSTIISVGFRASLFKNGQVFYREVKIEEGVKATGWTPAPEDASGEIDAFRSAAATSGLVTVVDKNTIQTGRLKADYMDVKGLTVNNGAVDTFKVDAGGNVSINGTVTVNSSSNVYTKDDSQKIATGVNNIGLGMKMNFGTFTTAATNKIYFHGFSYSDTNKLFSAADVNGFFYSYDNTTKEPIAKGVLDVSTGVPLVPGYIMYDKAYAKFYFIRFDVPSGNWYRYNVADSARNNQSFAFTSTMFIIGDVDLGS